MTEQIHNANSTSPAEGERRAMTGYLPQYELAAWAILRHPLAKSTSASRNLLTICSALLACPLQLYHQLVP